MIDLIRSEEELDEAYKLFCKFSNMKSDEFVWFVSKWQIRESVKNKECIVYKIDNKIVWVCKFHKRRDGYTTIYEICSDREYRWRWIWKEMIRYLLQHKHNIMLKCPTTNVSNQFYQHIWATLLWTQKWKKEKDLNIYHLNALNFKF